MLSPIDSVAEPVKADLRAHVAHALTLGLPEVDMLGSGGPIAIVGNGPSARAYEGWLPTLAINGALRLFPDGPDYWAACDPQALVCNFLKDAPRRTTYLMASKLHPAVFHMAMDMGLNIQLWHSADEETQDLLVGKERVPTAVSVTLSAMELMVGAGFDWVETWGWDGCLLDGEHHAVDQCHVAEEISFTVGADLSMGLIVGGETFRTTGTWVNEARDACALLETCGYDVKVHGPGMIGAVLRSRGLQAA